MSQTCTVQGVNVGRMQFIQIGHNDDGMRRLFDHSVAPFAMCMGHHCVRCKDQIPSGWQTMD